MFIQAYPGSGDLSYRAERPWGLYKGPRPRAGYGPKKKKAKQTPQFRSISSAL